MRYERRKGSTSRSPKTWVFVPLLGGVWGRGSSEGGQLVPVREKGGWSPAALYAFQGLEQKPRGVQPSGDPSLSSAQSEDQTWGPGWGAGG